MNPQDQDRLKKILALFDTTEFIRVKNGNNEVEGVHVSVVEHSHYQFDDTAIIIHYLAQ